MDEAVRTDISKSLAPLREVVASLSAAANGVLPAGTKRRRMVRRAREAGVAALPALLRALTSESAKESAWAGFLLRRIGGPRVVARLSALLSDPGIDDEVKARVLGLLSDLKAPAPQDVVLRDPEGMLETSVADLLTSLNSRAEMAQAVELILEQVPHAEIATFVTEVLEQGGPHAVRLCDALLADPRLPATVGQRLAELASGTARRPSRDSQMLDRALGQLQAGKPQRARKWLDSLVVNHPEDAEVRSAFGVCLLELNLPEAAIPHLLRAVALQPQAPLHRWNLAAAARAADQMGLCYRTLRAYQDQSDREDGAEERRAEAQTFCAAYEVMLQESYPGVPLSRVLRGEDLFAVAYEALLDLRYDEAMARFREVLHLVPGHYPSWGNLGAAYLAVRRRDEAVRCLRRALELNPNYAMARDNLAMLEQQRVGG